MKWLYAFILGICEYKMDSTTHFDEPEINYYDKGRAFAKHLSGDKY